MARTRKQQIKLGCLVVFMIAAAFCWWFYGGIIKYLGPMLYRQMTDRKKEYTGTSIDNLKAMRNALMSYEESEGQFPEAGGWMTAIEKRIVTDDLKSGEAEKKLILPEFVGQPGKFGYAFNDAASAKYHGDVKDPKTPLVFESVSDGKNAHGDPVRERKTHGLAIAVDGTVLEPTKP